MVPFVDGQISPARLLTEAKIRVTCLHGEVPVLSLHLVQAQSLVSGSPRGSKSLKLTSWNFFCSRSIGFLFCIQLPLWFQLTIILALRDFLHFLFCDLSSAVTSTFITIYPAFGCFMVTANFPVCHSYRNLTQYFTILSLELLRSFFPRGKTGGC